MRVHVVDAIEWFAWQAGTIEVVDVAVARVEEVERIDDQRKPLPEPVTCLRGDQARRVRSSRIVLDQRTRTEIAPPDTAHDAARTVGR